ncbi:MAG TPA: Crp/Fnr family transcriptional regulator [Syntrophorhabdaceae bacterium]|nr:Crp/Fnr family transcriptional regulator [Syntrophorhabdaceae bacterium]
MESNYLYDLVTSMDFAKGIPKEELRKLLKHKKIVNLKKDDFFLLAGKIPDYLGFVISGLLRLFYIDDSGKEINKHFCLEKTVAVAYKPFIRREESEIYIQALEDTKLLVIDYKTYNMLLNSHTCWETIARKMAELIFILAQKRESEFLLVDAQQRYQQFMLDYPNLANRISQYHIASYLGITPESLSRIRAHLKQS